MAKLECLHEQIKVEGFVFIQTCGACPEQYDVYLNDKRVAYVRLRYGRLTAKNSKGEEIYKALFNNGWKGAFREIEERQYYFEKIIEAISRNLESQT